MAGLIGSIRCSSSISLDCRLKPKDMLQKLRPLPVLRTPSRPTNSSSRKAQTFVGKLYPQTDSRSLVPAYFLAVREWGRAWHTTPREVISWSRMNGNMRVTRIFVEIFISNEPPGQIALWCLMMLATPPYLFQRSALDRSSWSHGAGSRELCGSPEAPVQSRRSVCAVL